MMRRILGRSKRHLCNHGRLLKRMIAPWFVRRPLSQKKTDEEVFVIRMDPAPCSKAAMLRTYICFLLQRERWMLILDDASAQGVPRYLHKSKRVLQPRQIPKGNVFLGHITAGTRLHPCALRCFRNALQADNDVVYSDQFVKERKKGEARILLRPGYNPSFLRSQDYLGDLVVFKAGLLSETARQKWYSGELPLYEAELLLSEKTEHFYRCPMLLYAAATRQCGNESIEILRRHLCKTDPGTIVTTGANDTISHIRYPLTPVHKVSIIIPNRDHAEDLRKCIESIRSRSTWQNYEILIVENGSTETDVLAYYDELKTDETARIIPWERPYNFAAICNEAAKHATGCILLFLNNDVEVITPEWLEEMLMYAQRDGVGAVGAKLLYPDGTVQHGGVILGVAGIAGHAYKHLAEDDLRNMGQLQSVRNCTAVTGACLMVDKQRYLAVGGMDEELAVAYNDIDLCLKLREAGFRNVYTPYASLYHYESKTRGAEDGLKRKRFEQETVLMKKRWQKQLAQGDPYHHPHYNRFDEQYTLI